ncbi:MAG: hypothetical protein H0W68_07125 [Gemmatimonadaceae bacterium]|nr:hypothetical protein [Gemmatimonadaceae bacterium]
MIQLSLQLLALVGLAGIFVQLRALVRRGGEPPAAFATKQDVREVLDKLDAQRVVQSTDVARLKSDHSSGNSVKQFQFEAELRTYEEIWEMLVEVQRSTESLQPMIESVQIRDESIRDARDRKRLADFAAIFNNFTAYVQRHRPFFPPAIYLELQRLMSLAHGDAIDIAHVREHHDPDYWLSARDNAEALTTQVDRIAEVIRDRLRLTGVA